LRGEKGDECLSFVGEGKKKGWMVQVGKMATKKRTGQGGEIRKISGDEEGAGKRARGMTPPPIGGDRLLELVGEGRGVPPFGGMGGTTESVICRERPGIEEDRGGIAGANDR